MKIGNQNKKNFKLQRGMTGLQRFGVVIRIAILVVVVVVLAWSQNNFIISNNYIFTSSRVPKTFVGYKIAQVSDIHNDISGIYNKVKGTKPDIIVVSGGLSDDNGDYSKSLKLLNKLQNIAPTYFVLGDNDENVSITDIINGVDGPEFVQDSVIGIKAPEISTSAYIDKYIGSKIINDANSGDEDAIEYINYTKEKLENDKDAVLMLSGLDSMTPENSVVDTIYSIIGTDKEPFQVCLLNNISLFDTLSIADIDIVFAGSTHGNKIDNSKYSKGIYAENGTTLILSGGTGNTEKYPSRFFNYPEISVVTLSDGTIKDENPLEKFLGIFINDVKTKFDGDEGFKTYKYVYSNGQEKN